MTTRTTSPVRQGSTARRVICDSCLAGANAIVQREGVPPFDVAVGMAAAVVALLCDPAVCTPAQGRQVLLDAVAAFDADLPPEVPH